MKQYVFFVVCLLAYGALKAQNVGISTQSSFSPTERLDVDGRVRVRSLPLISVGTQPSIVVANPSGVLGFVSLDSLAANSPDTTGPVNLFVYGEDISAGSTVCVGDGLTGYPSAGHSLPVGPISISSGTWIAQTFITSGTATGIRAVRFRASISNTTFIVKIQACASGIPNGLDLGSSSYTHSGTSSGEITMIFDPPVMVLPNTQYAFIVSYSPNSSLNFFYTNTNPYSGGSRLTSTNNGSTWVSFANDDLMFLVYETQTSPGKVYNSKVVSGSLNPTVNTSYLTGSPTYYDVGDKLDNFIGVALESGVSGETKEVSLGQVCTGFVGLQPGRNYYLSSTPGQVTLTPPTLVRKAGLALSPTKLLLLR